MSATFKKLIQDHFKLVHILNMITKYSSCKYNLTNLQFHSIWYSWITEIILQLCKNKNNKMWMPSTTLCKQTGKVFLLNIWIHEQIGQIMIGKHPIVQRVWDQFQEDMGAVNVWEQAQDSMVCWRECAHCFWRTTQPVNNVNKFIHQCLAILVIEAVYKLWDGQYIINSTSIAIPLRTKYLWIFKQL